MATRYNKSTNPTCGVDLTGWFGGSVTRLTGLSGPPRTTGGRVSIAGAFENSIAGGYALAASGIAGGETVTVVGWVRTSVSRVLRIAISVYDGGSFVATSSTFTDFTPGANTWTQVRHTGTVPGGTWDSIHLHVDAPGAVSSNVDLSSVRIEEVNDNTLVYADGASGSGWAWDGTADQSSSTQPDGLSAAATATTTATATATASTGGATAAATRGFLVLL